MKAMWPFVAAVFASMLAPVLAAAGPALDRTPVTALIAATPALVKIPTKIRVPPTVRHYRFGTGADAIEGYIDPTERFVARGIIETGQTVVAVPMSSGRELGPTHVLVWASLGGGMTFIGYVPRAAGDITAKVAGGYLVIDTAFDRERAGATCATSHRIETDTLAGIKLVTVRDSTLEGACTPLEH